ncbi:MAG: YdeI/OmpD-associated family protein [Candidatus Acidiferrum sp.]
MSSEANPYVFAAKIQKIWIMRCIDVPRDISKAVRKEAGENTKHVPVHGWIEGLPFQNTLVPRGGGNYRFHIHSRIWRKLRIDAGAAVEVTMLLDREPREVAVPPDLAAELADTPRALAAFNAITPALRRHIVGWVEAAKQMKTREKRVQLTVTRMVEQSRKKRKR